MYQVTSRFLEVMAKPAQRRRCKGTISAIPFNDKNIIQGSTVITNQCSDNTSILIGQVYVGQLNITLRGLSIPRKTYKGREIILYQSLDITEPGGLETYEDVKLGHFFVEEATWTMSGVVITAYDAMSKFDKNITSFVNYGTIYDFVYIACTACGVSLGMQQSDFQQFANTNINIVVYSDNDMQTWRDLISWCAQTMGANATINRDGQLVFRKYNQIVVDSLDTRRRLEGASFSDFDSFYTGLSMVNIAEQTTSYYGLPVDNGLTMNLGSNPLVQYGSPQQLEEERRAILDKISVINYTPAKVKINALMIYDLMDVLEFTGGFAGDSLKVCITKFTWKLNGDYTIECVGTDPALASAKSKVDKNLAGILSQLDENEMHYYDYVNSRRYVIGSGQKAKIIKIRYVTKKDTHVEFHGEVKYTLETIESSSEYQVENDGTFIVTYYNGGEEIREYHPKETRLDGTHLLHLLHFWNANKDEAQMFEVEIEAINCNIVIDVPDARGFLSGTGLAGIGEWDGTLILEDDFYAISLADIMFADNISDTLLLNVQQPIPIIKTENIVPINLANNMLITGISDTLLLNECMFFTTKTNVGMLERTATISGNNFVNGEVVTPKVSNFTKVVTTSTGCAFYASFDDGITWLAYSQTDGWVEGASMTAAELENVPSSAWLDDTKIKAVIDTNSTLTQILFEGGTL